MWLTFNMKCEVEGTQVEVAIGVVIVVIYICLVAGPVQRIDVIVGTQAECLPRSPFDPLHVYCLRVLVGLWALHLERTYHVDVITPGDDVRSYANTDRPLADNRYGGRGYANEPLVPFTLGEI